VKRFTKYCVGRGSTWKEATEVDVASFLDYVTLKTARPEVIIKGAMVTILALYEGTEIGAPIHHLLFSRLKKGYIVLCTTRVVEHRQLISVHKVVEWIESLPPNVRLAIDLLHLKLVVLSVILLIAHLSDLVKLLLALKDHVSLCLLVFKNDYHHIGWQGKMFLSFKENLD
jgi:hypothetical protein